MNILIVAEFIKTPSENGNSRFTYLADKLGKDNKVELITTSFSHGLKRQREFQGKIKTNYKLTIIKEPGYKKNVSLRRFYSHYIFSKNVKKYLTSLDNKPDVIYCSIPSLDVAKEVTKFAKKNQIRLIVDIQDLWPEAFKMVFNLPPISDFIYWPMKMKAEYVYKNADNIIAVSETYLNRALKVNQKSNKNMVTFLGTELNKFDSYKKEKTEENEKTKVVFIGTLGHSYNIKIIIDALDILYKKGVNDIEFIIMGTGPLENEFKEYAESKDVKCKFLGMLPYSKMVQELCSCDIAVNPINNGSAGSIINKVGDYAAAGLSVVNTQECEEYKNIVEQYNIGFNCKNDNENDIAEKIEILYKDKELRKRLGKNNRMLAEEKFDRDKTYKDIINLIKLEN